MSKSELKETIVVTCPSGHRLRGDVSLIGKQVQCPRCEEKFAIGEPKRPSLSESTVMRILGDGPGILPEPPEMKTKETQDCPRCGMANNKSATVCSHCDCYMGAMPNFMQKMFGDRNIKRA